jgi:hypothetical protein
VNSGTPRARIADIIRDSGKMGGDAPGASPEQLAAAASALSGLAGGVSPGTFAAAEAIDEALAKRFSALSPTATVERDVEAPYESAGRALILALQACGFNVAAAFDTDSGAVLEANKPLSVASVAFAVTLAITDRGATTHLNGKAQHIGVDWGGQNVKLLNALFDKTNDYLKLFKS